MATRGTLGGASVIKPDRLRVFERSVELSRPHLPRSSASDMETSLHGPENAACGFDVAHDSVVPGRRADNPGAPPEMPLLLPEALVILARVDVSLADIARELGPPLPAIEALLAG
jgi:hypothetical protein